MAAPNDTILIPGSWTYPIRGAAPAEIEINPGQNEDLVNINFGWDYQFLPYPDLGINQCVITTRALVRYGPSTLYPVTYSFPAGHLVEVLAKSVNLPLWLKVIDADGYKGWVYSELVDCPNTDLVDVETEPNPDMPDEPKKTKSPHETQCSKDLSINECIAAGGTWVPSTVIPPYCDCP